MCAPRARASRATCSRTAAPGVLFSACVCFLALRGSVGRVWARPSFYFFGYSFVYFSFFSLVPSFLFVLPSCATALKRQRIGKRTVKKARRFAIPIIQTLHHSFFSWRFLSVVLCAFPLFTILARIKFIAQSIKHGSVYVCMIQCFLYCF